MKDLTEFLLPLIAAIMAMFALIFILLYVVSHLIVVTQTSYDVECQDKFGVGWQYYRNYNEANACTNEDGVIKYY